jgi:hypothetical protein
VIGLRGSPLEAPENTLASLERALDLGLDGVAYDVRACASGEAVLLLDPTLDRTTDGRGPLVEQTLPEISRLDAGTWFGARFQGEPLALLEEALAVGGGTGHDPDTAARSGSARGTAPGRMHLVYLREAGLVSEVARLARNLPPGTALRVVSESRETCLEARDAGLESMLSLRDADAGARAFVRDERLTACALPVAAWRRALSTESWDCERWSLGVDEPSQLLAAFRSRLHGIATREPLRALSTRALVACAPDDDGPFPIEAPELPIALGGSSGLPGTRGEWCGTWNLDARIRNPFPFAVTVTVAVLPRHGAFESEGLPRRLDLEPGGAEKVAFRLTGGSWRTGGDPLLSALYRWKRGTGRRAGALLLDAPLARIRRARADGLAVRLPLLRESPGDGAASMVLRRRGRDLFVAIESPGDLEDARTVVHLDGRTLRGGRGLRARLPEDFDHRPGGVPFSCGIESLSGDARRFRRWAGGIPEADDVGSPGRLLPRG